MNIAAVTRPFFYAVLILVSVFLLACNKGVSPLKWTEDVRLPDERIVTLTRQQNFDDFDYVSSHWLEFRHPDTGETIRWENSGTMRNVELFIHERQVNIVVTPTFASHSDLSGCPEPPYFIYRYNAGQWEQYPLLQSPLKQIKENVTIDPKLAREDIKKHNNQLTSRDIDGFIFNHRSEPVNFDLNKITEQKFFCPQQRRHNLK